MKRSYFDGFPYLMTRVAPSVYHVAVLPADLGVDHLMSIARGQVGANKLDTCLVLDRASCVYFDRDRYGRPSTVIPRGGLVFTDRLHLCEQFRTSAELSQRQGRLRAFVGDMPSGCLFGNLTKRGRRATQNELEELAGLQAGGVPFGLERCRTCGEWRGECLDSTGMVVSLCCHCDNDTLCARCGHPLADRRVNANYWDGGVRPVPGMLALDHVCTVFTIAAQDVIGCLISSGVVLSVEGDGRQWLLHVKCDEGDEGYEEKVGPFSAKALIEELKLREYRVRGFIDDLRRYDEPKLNRLARQMERRQHA